MKKFEKFVKDGAFIERENGNVPYSEIIYRLKSYEDTNLLPKEIERLKLVEKLYQESSIGDIYNERGGIMKRFTEKRSLITDKISTLDYKYKANLFGAICEEKRQYHAYYIYHKAIDKLAEYENTNLTPKEVLELKQNQNKVAIDCLYKLFDTMTWNGWSGDTQINAMELYTETEKLIQELKGGSDDKN